MKKMKKTFRSRISVLLVGFILAVFIPVSIPMFRYGINEGLYILAGTLLFIVLLFTGMRYIIADGRLYLKMWFISNGSVCISDILSIERSYNPLSSPAASLRRLCIKFKKGSKPPYWLISPVNEREFLETLKSINPDIHIRAPGEKGKWRIWDWDI
jgi:hypothetical protein